MSDSTTNLDTIATAQSQKEASANALFDAMGQAALFGRRASTTSALTWGYYGGDVLLSGVPTSVANGTLQLVPSVTQQIEVGPFSTSTTAITGISIANPCVITVASHPFAVGDVLYLAGIVGTTQLNQSVARVTAQTATTLTLSISSVGMTAWSSGGTLARMTDSGTWALQIAKGLSSAFVCPVPLYQIVAGAATVTSYTDQRIHGMPALGYVAASIAGAVDVVATAAQCRARFIDLTGAITANLSFILPRLSGDVVIRNSATGAFTVTAKCPGSTGLTIAAGAIRHLVCDGTDMLAVS